MPKAVILSILVLTTAPSLAEQKTWTVDTQEEWEKALTTKSQLALKDGMASPTNRTVVLQ